MLRNITVGIDLGTHQIKVVVVESVKENGRRQSRVIGVGVAESRGLRHGYIVNTAEATESIAEAIHLAEKNSGMKIRKSFVAASGAGLQGFSYSTSILVSRSDMEITDFDVTKIAEVCEETLPANATQNKRILHSIPISYKIDGKAILDKTPVGMKGSKLEVKMLFITCLEPHIVNLMEAVEKVGVEIVDVLAGPIASSFVTLSKTQKMAGCILTDIGRESTSIIVFENNVPVSLEVIQLGSNDITNDIALGFKIPLEEAENVKLGGVGANSYPKKKLDEIIQARLYDMFELIENHLKKIGRNELLPAGIMLTGGGASMQILEDFAKNALKLPARIAVINQNDQKSGMKDLRLAVAYGLCILGMSKEEKINLGLKNTLSNSSKKIFGWMKQFLP